MSDDTETPREPWNADGGTAMTNAAAVIASAASEQATASPTAEGEGGSDAPASATGSAPEGQSTGKAGEPMQGSSTESETIVVHSDSTIE